VLILDTPNAILDYVRSQHPEVDTILDLVRSRIPKSKREIDLYQAAALYHLVKRYDRPRATILEIGTAYGYSAAVMAFAAPQAQIITINPKESEYVQALYNLAVFPGVTVLNKTSREILKTCIEPVYDVVFVDGDHREQGVGLDCHFWKYVNYGGTILFHDYSPEGSRRATPEVYKVVTLFRARVGRDFDIMISDNTGASMVGFVKKEDDT
jgi:predicted O-methyltransferase YrrM